MMPLVSSSFFLSGRFPVDSVRSIKASPVTLLYPRMVSVGIVEPGAHVPARGVIKEMAAFPMTAPETGPEITKPIVNPAVETDVRSPITGVPKVAPVTPTPPSRRPEKSDFRRLYPNARDPVIVIISPGPIARIPEVSISRARRLIVDGDYRRRDGNRDVCGGKQRRKPQQACEEHKVHSFRNELQHRMGCNRIQVPCVLGETKRPSEERRLLSKDRSSGPIPERAGYWISGETGENDLKNFIGSPIKRSNPRMVAHLQCRRNQASKRSATQFVISVSAISAEV
jgi:hypothetical protein